MKKLPTQDDWKDHAVPCTNCKEPVLEDYEHYNLATRTDQGWWSCDFVEDVEYTVHRRVK